VITLSRPLASSTAAGLLALGVRYAYGYALSPIPRLVLELTVLLSAFAGLLLFATGQKRFYLDLLRGLKGRTAVQGQTLASA